MLTTRALSRLASPWLRRPRALSTAPIDVNDTNAFVDHCDLNLVHSPYPPVPEGPYLPMAEWVMQHWKAHNQDGFLSEQPAIRDISTNLVRSFDDYYNTTTLVGGFLKEELDLEEDQCVALYCPNHVDYLKRKALLTCPWKSRIAMILTLTITIM